MKVSNTNVNAVVKSGLINVDDIDYTYCWGVKRYAKDIAE